MGADGRGVGGVSGHLVTPLPPLDTDTSIVKKEEGRRRRRRRENKIGKRENGRARGRNVKKRGDGDGWDDKVQEGRQEEGKKRQKKREVSAED